MVSLHKPGKCVICCYSSKKKHDLLHLYISRNCVHKAPSDKVNTLSASCAVHSAWALPEKLTERLVFKEESKDTMSSDHKCLVKVIFFLIGIRTLDFHR